MIIVKKESVITRVEENGEAFLFNTLNGQFKRLNRTGTMIWELCTQRNIDEIADLVGERFPSVSKEKIRLDVMNFIKDLFERKLIEYQDEGNSSVGSL